MTPTIINSVGLRPNIDAPLCSLQLNNPRRTGRRELHDNLCPTRKWVTDDRGSAGQLLRSVGFVHFRPDEPRFDFNTRLASTANVERP